jgi:hypothetical protein
MIRVDCPSVSRGSRGGGVMEQSITDCAPTSCSPKYTCRISLCFSAEGTIRRETLRDYELGAVLEARLRAEPAVGGHPQVIRSGWRPAGWPAREGLWTAQPPPPPAGVQPKGTPRDALSWWIGFGPLVRTCPPGGR